MLNNYIFNSCTQNMPNFTENIEDYQIQNLLGEGGFAKVWRATFKGAENVAIKIIDKKIMQNGIIDRIRQEVDIHYRLKHESILELYTFFEDPYNVYLVLELADRDMYQYWKDKAGSFTESEIAGLLKKIIDGIEYMHAHNVIHRDISLSNILLTKNLDVKISDFGLATYANTSRSHKTLCGTANYMSPEVVLKTEHSFPVDLWSVGSIFYTLLVGRPPFETNTVQSTLTQVVMADPYIPDSISYEAKDLLKKLLCRDTQKRIKIGEVLQHPLMLKYQKLSQFSHISTQLVMKKDFGSAKLTVPPLNSVRLQPVRFETRNAILHILKNQEIVLEFLKTKYKSVIVEDVCRISSDGLRIIIYRPNNGNGIFVKETPAEIPDNGAEFIYSYENLPTKFHKKYYYAARFVDMVKAKTPKIIFYSNQAKFQLMENLENYEMFFYDGWKIIKSNSEDLKLYNEREVKVENYFCGSKIQHCEDCLKHCMQIESSLSQITSEFTVFPVIVGRRPTTSSSDRDNTFNNHISSSQTTFKTPNFKFSSFAS